MKGQIYHYDSYDKNTTSCFNKACQLEALLSKQGMCFVLLLKVIQRYVTNLEYSMLNTIHCGRPFAVTLRTISGSQMAC